MFARILIAAPVIAAALFAVAPAAAAPADCATAPATLRAAASTAQPDAARKALLAVRTGEALCAADARAEAGRKFAYAAKTLGVDVAQLSAATTAAN